MAFEYIAFNIKEEPLDIVASDATTGDADPLFDVPVAADQNYPEVTIKTESDDDSSNILYIKLEPDNVLSAVDQLDADEYYELALSKLMPLQEAAKGDFFECVYCAQRFSSFDALQAHCQLNVVDIDEPPRCIQCDRVFPSQQCHRAHVESFHLRSNRIWCRLCPMRFRSWLKYTYHTRFEHLNAACQQCDARFSNDTALDTHRKLHQTIPSQRLKFNKKIHLDKVMTAVGYVRCVLCAQVYKDQRVLIAHIKQFHDPDLQFECQFCTRRFKNAARLSGHTHSQQIVNIVDIQSTHPSNQPQHSCSPAASGHHHHDSPVCYLERAEARRSAMTDILNRQKRRQGSDHLICALCARPCFTWAIMLNHLRYHHNPMLAFPCESCSYRFKTQVELVMHFGQQHRA